MCPLFWHQAIPFCMHPAMSGCPAASSVLYLLSVVCMYPFLAAVHVAVCSPFFACIHFWLPCMSRCALFLCMYRFWLLCMSRCAPLSAHVSVSGCYSSRCASLALLCVRTSISGCTRMPISAFALTPEESLEPSMDPVIRM